MRGGRSRLRPISVCASQNGQYTDMAIWTYRIHYETTGAISP